MRIRLSQWDNLTPAQRQAVTHIDIDEPRAHQPLLGDAEEYAGEAADLRTDHRGFNK